MTTTWPCPRCSTHSDVTDDRPFSLRPEPVDHDRPWFRCPECGLYFQRYIGSDPDLITIQAERLAAKAKARQDALAVESRLHFARGLAD